MSRAWTLSPLSSRRSLASLQSLLGPDGPERLREALGLLVQAEAVLVRAAVRLDDPRQKTRVLGVVAHGRDVRAELEELLAGIENGSRADRRADPRPPQTGRAGSSAEPPPAGPAGA